jgi:predicted metal-dependent phosphoesterase TrpH
MSVQPDLHTHSNASDGTLSPAELVARAAAAGVPAIALTDHDTTEGIAEAGPAARAAAVTLIAGVEVSANWGGRTVHILGLGVDPSAPMLRRGLARLREFRDWRAQEIGRRLARAGIPAAFEGARSLSNGRLVGRTHFARFLVQTGRAGSVREVFRHYLVEGKPGHVKGDWAPMEEAVAWITAAGGQAVIAHPARYRFTRSKVLRMIGEFREQGGEGLEVVSGSHGPGDVETFARHAREQGLLASAGSDFHGPGNPYMDLGRLPPLPPGCRPIWGGWDLDGAVRAERA